MFSFLAFVVAGIVTTLSYALEWTASWWLLLIFFSVWPVAWIIIRFMKGDGVDDIGGAFFDIGGGFGDGGGFGGGDGGGGGGGGGGDGGGGGC